MISRRKCLSLTLVIGLVLGGCPNESVSLVNRRNYKDLSERLEIGYAYDNLPVTSRRVLGDLEAYVEKHKRKIYKGEECRHVFHRGLMQLYAADFFAAFCTLKEYVEITGDTVGPYYHTGHVLFRQYDLTGVEISSLCAVAQSLPNQTRLVLGQHRALLSLISDSPGYPFAWLEVGVLDEQVKQTDEYKQAYELYLTAVSNAEWSLERRFERSSISSVFTDEHVERFERNSDPTDKEVDFMVAYHLHPYHTDYQKAASWADKRNHPIDRGDFLNYSLTCNIMRAYLGVDRYEDAIRVYERNRSQVSADIRELKASQEHLYLYVSAAYAGKGELDRSLEYLEKELSITEIHESWLRTEAPTTLEDLVKNGDMLYSLFAMVFLLDEFEEFEQAGRYSEIEELVERYVGRYEHLPVFNRD
jgi:tetratricopeptide (TPR) repeat protein